MNEIYTKAAKEMKRHAHNFQARLSGKPIWYASFEKYLQKNYEGPYSATDAIIRMKDEDGTEGVVLIGRKFEPYGIAFPGGMGEKMNFEENTIKEAKEETGLAFRIDAPEQPYRVTSSLRNDSRAHIASHYYTGVGTGIIKPDPKEDAKFARLFPLAELESLVNDEAVWASPAHRRVMVSYLGDHKDIVAKYGW